MSRAGVQQQQRVLRAVRLLSQAIKIGISEPEPEELAEGVQSPEDTVADASITSDSSAILGESDELSEKSKKSDNSGDGTRVAAPTSPSISKAEREAASERTRAANHKLLKQLEEQVKSLRADLEAKDAELAAKDAVIATIDAVKAERDKIAGEINGVKADYEKRRKELDANAAAEAKKVADEAREKARNEGWASGHADGLKTARFELEKEYHDRFDALVKSLEGVNTKLSKSFDDLVELNQPKMLRLWSSMLRKMLNRDIELDPTAVNKVLKEVLTQVSDRNQILIYVSPQDLRRLQGKDGDLDDKVRDSLRGAKHVELKPDSNVEPGSCIVETSFGVYDARWRTQFEQIDTALDSLFQELTSAQGGAKS